VPQQGLRNSTFRVRSRLMSQMRRFRRRRLPNLPPNADQITGQLVVGGFIDRGDWRLLVDQGVSVVVSLQAERHDEDSFGDLQPDGYLRLPTTDFSPPTLSQLRMGAAFIDEAVRAGKTVLIHCHAGVGRSALQCASYLIYAGMDIDEAWDLLRSKRPVVYLNERQRAMLEEFAAVITAERTATVVPASGPEPEPRIVDVGGA
jgi:dual specificity MAP kinase phosphatase